MIDIAKWCEKVPVLEDVIQYKETVWFNPDIAESRSILSSLPLSTEDIEEAEARLERFRPYIAAMFPETRGDNGLIESPLVPIPEMQRKLSATSGIILPGNMILKCDNLLPISGSVKARGGIYEVLKYAEKVATGNNILKPNDNYISLAGKDAKNLLSGYRIAVGSTGNLGLSIGIMGAKLGFEVFVHMSSDAREWKKRLLKGAGVRVIEYDGDYSKAVAGGRLQAEKDPHCHFIDDENSRDLFLGYAVAARRLMNQLGKAAIPVNKHHPLFVYLPCGVGGGPGGIAFGLKQLFGDDVHCFFGEPTHSPCMLLGLCTGLHDKVSVRDFGLDNITAADGLAVGRPSGFVGKLMTNLIDGVYSVDDDQLFRYLALLADSEGIRMEPSALAGIPGPVRILGAPGYLKLHGMEKILKKATHIVWGTGGSMVPPTEMEEYYQKGKQLIITGKCR